MINELNNLFRPARLSRSRIVLALLIALAADGLQIPFQVAPPVPEVIDVIAALLTVWLLGFHILLLPTFILEFIPLVGMLPTWTGCVAAVIALRKRSENTPSEKPPPFVDVPVSVSPTVPSKRPHSAESGTNPTTK